MSLYADSEWDNGDDKQANTESESQLFICHSDRFRNFLLALISVSAVKQNSVPHTLLCCCLCCSFVSKENIKKIN